MELSNHSVTVSSRSAIDIASTGAYAPTVVPSGKSSSTWVTFSNSACAIRIFENFCQCWQRESHPGYLLRGVSGRGTTRRTSLMRPPLCAQTFRSINQTTAHMHGGNGLEDAGISPPSPAERTGCGHP